MLERLGRTRTYRVRMGAIVVLAFAVRVTYTMVWSRNAVVGFDASSYYELAKSLATHRAFDTTELPRHSTALFPPGFPAFLAIGRFLGLGTRTKLLLWTSLLGTATVGMTGMLAKRVGGERVALVAALIAALYPNLWLADGAMMTESLSGALTVAILLLTLRVKSAPELRDALLLGGALAWLALTRSDGVIVAVCVVFVVWRSRLRAAGADPGLGRAQRLRAVAVIVLVPVVVLAGWQVRNQVQMKAFVPIAVNGWTVVAGANCHATYYGERVGSWELPCVKTVEAFQRKGLKGEIAQNRYARDVGMDYLRAHLSRLPVVAAARVGLTFGVYDPWREIEIEALFEGRSDLWAKLGYVMYLVLAVLACFGVARVRRIAPGALSVLAIPFVAVVVSTVFGYGNQRFRMPLEPVIVVLAAVALAARQEVES